EKERAGADAQSDDAANAGGKQGAQRRDDDIPITGTTVLPFIDEADFPHFRRHFAWPLVRTYEEWLDAARLDDGLRRRTGVHTNRVHIRFAQAIDLCAEKNLPRNYQSLLRRLIETTAPEEEAPAPDTDST